MNVRRCLAMLPVLRKPQYLLIGTHVSAMRVTGHLSGGAESVSQSLFQADASIDPPYLAVRAMPLTFQSKSPSGPPPSGGLPL